MFRLLLFIVLLSCLLFSKEYKYTNSLINSNSPYLLQHAHNPINWYEWNQKSLDKAKKENKLIFLSIGYSTCHWCHVMEKESFENEALATIFNKYYISIKIDREIKSDLDLYYQEILSALKTRRNGWPLNAILTPNLEVLYIATYIPPTFNYGVEGLDVLLPKYAEIYRDKKSLETLVSQNKKAIQEARQFPKKDQSYLEKQIIEQMIKVYDNGFKGFFKTPRFPHSANLELLFDIYDLTKNKEVLKMVLEPLRAMANGGIYDQVEGAFFRYSVHQDWIVPHFEKMLYTTAELIPLYVRAYEQTKDPLFKKVVVQSIEQIEKRFIKNGLFFSASNADSDGLEGRYFVYSYEEASKALLKHGFNEAEIEENLEYLDITEIGNFEEDLSNPHLNNNFKEDVRPQKLEKTLKILKEIRKQREYPFIDKKVITSWNAMMIKAYLIAGEISKIYEVKGLNYLDTLVKELTKDGQLYHFKIEAKPLKSKAILEDYAFLSDTLLYAYKLTLDKNYLIKVKTLLARANQNFFKNSSWYLSYDALSIEGNFIDKYYTSALSKILSANLTLASLIHDRKLYNETKNTILKYKDKILHDISAHPSGVRLLLRIQKGDIVLKSKKANLFKEKANIKALKYPFFLLKDEKEDNFLACDIDSCFGYDKDFKNVKLIIEKRVKE